MNWLLDDEVIEEEYIIQSLWAGAGSLTRVRSNLRSVVIKKVDLPQNSDVSKIGTARKLKSYRVEQTFYEIYAKCLPPDIVVPELVGVGEVSGECLVLSDLNVLGFDERRESLSKSEAYSVIAWLAKKNTSTFHIKKYFNLKTHFFIFFYFFYNVCSLCRPPHFSS